MTTLENKLIVYYLKGQVIVSAVLLVIIGIVMLY